MTVGMIKALLIGDNLMMVAPSLNPSAQPVSILWTRSGTLGEASVHLRQRRFDIVLVNLTGTDTDQIDTIQDLHEQIDSTPIVVISSSDDPAFVSLAVRQGAQDVMPSSTLEPSVLERTMMTSIERKRLEQYRIRHARKDTLTGLANRLLLEERFGRAMARADRHATLVALVAIDLDQPKQLIEFHGRHAVDHLMPLIGKRLMSEIRETDTLARTRDAGFTWLVEGLGTINDISILVDRLPKLLANSFNLGYREVRVTASVGVAVYPFHGRDFPTLHKMAEAAMLDVATLNGDGLLMTPLPAIAENSRAVPLA